MQIKKGDLVQVITGKDKGVTGKVIQAYPNTERILVEGVNRIKKHTKVTTTQRGAQSGGIVTQEAPIHVSNVMIVDPSDNKPTRIGHKVTEDGRRVRISRRTGTEL
ncbi:MAG TPA: 50S ribosomal protein L24 [Mycobacteriales bacterium]|nr:50S ribosomal protein L24 [Mycobacteriales bacterium]